MEKNTTIGLHLAKMGAKRRARSSLTELDNMEDNGKWVRVEGEVKELGKLLAQHFRSAEAVNQPRRAQ